MGRSIQDIMGLIASGQSGKLSEDEVKQARSFLRNSGVIPKTIAKKDEPNDALVSATPDLQAAIRSLVKAVRPTIKGKKSYFLLAFDERGFGNCRLVEIWKQDAEGRNHQMDNWEGPRGYESVDLSK